MPLCVVCRDQLYRISRSRLQKIFYSGVFKCSHCGIRLALYHTFWQRQVTAARFLLSWHSRCVRCSTYDVHGMEKRDKLDPFTRNPLGLWQALLLAPLKKCGHCRLQYFDWRPLKPPVAARQNSSENSA